MEISQIEARELEAEIYIAVEDFKKSIQYFYGKRRRLSRICRKDLKKIILISNKLRMIISRDSYAWTKEECAAERRKRNGKLN